MCIVKFVCKKDYHYICNMWAIYTYMELCKKMYGIYIYIYVLHAHLIVLMLCLCCICVNGCNCMQMHAPLHIIMDRPQAGHTAIIVILHRYILYVKL